MCSSHLFRSCCPALRVSAFGCRPALRIPPGSTTFAGMHHPTLLVHILHHSPIDPAHILIAEGPAWTVTSAELAWLFEDAPVDGVNRDGGRRVEHPQQHHFAMRLAIARPTQWLDVLQLSDYHANHAVWRIQCWLTLQQQAWPAEVGDCREQGLVHALGGCLCG